jgi:hypothetical protein
MGGLIDLTGQQFSRLHVIERVGTSHNGSALWLCQCSCGNTKVASTAHLRGGFIQSCGCLHSEKSAETGKKQATHGARRRTVHDPYARLYGIWRGIRYRCNSKNSQAYKNYGGRGITICDEWKDFETFKQWAMSTGYDLTAPYGDCTIERIDVNGNYCPENCCWIPLSEQTKNRRITRRADGKYASLEEEEDQHV